MLVRSAAPDLWQNAVAGTDSGDGLRRFWILAGALGVATAAGAEAVVLEAVERGRFRENGSYELGPEAEYAVGRGGLGEERSVLVFDLAELEASATSATLRIWSPVDGTVSPDGRERVVAYAVSSDPERLVWEPTHEPANTPWGPPEPALGTFWDLGTGVSLGTARIDTHSSGFVEIPLDPAILRASNRSNGQIALGLRVESLRRRNRNQPVIEERVFVNTGPDASVPRPQLVLVTDAGVNPGPELTLFVDAQARRRHGSGAEAAPFRTIAAALDLATPGDRVAVAPGLYFETLIMKAGVDVLGAGADRTMLGLGSALPSVRCADAKLDGFLVRRTLDSREAVDCTNGTSPWISNSAIEAGSAAIRLEESRATLQGNQIFGSIEGVDSSPVVIGNEIFGSFYGAYLSFQGSEPLAPLRIERNRIEGKLWLICAVPSGSRVVGNLFLPTPSFGFFATNGGISFVGSGDLGLIGSNTFFRTLGIALGELARPIAASPCDGEKSATIANNILAFGDTGISLDVHSSATIVHNDVFGNRSRVPFGADRNYVGLPDLTGIDGNISLDPLFGGSGFDEALLYPASPVIDAGLNGFAVSDHDLDGDPRLVDATGSGSATIDLGAQEHQPGEGLALPVQIRVETDPRANFFGFRNWLVPIRWVRVAILSDEAFDAPEQVDATSLTFVSGSAPRLDRRCRARDVDNDGDDDLSCRFPFSALENLPRLVAKRVCLFGELLDGSPIRGCDRVDLVYLKPAGQR